MKTLDLLAASALALVLATPAMAQEAGAPAAEESADEGDIIVTASKRVQTLQDIPISVSVTSADTLEKAQIVDLISLQSVVPSLKVTQFQSAGQTNFTIRGFGNGNGNIGIESSVGVFIDGVYRSRSASALSDLPEVERIEVLRGPQSTLFGKNVSAGAISVVTKRPQFEWGVRAEATAGNYGLIEANASVTGPISDSLAFRLYGSVNQRDGYNTNIVNGRDINDRDRFGIRADLLFEPSSEFSIRIIADYNKIDEVCCGVGSIFNGPATQIIGAPRAAGGVGAVIGNPARFFERELVFNTTPYNRLTGKGISAQVDWDTGFGKLTSITSYRRQTNDTTLDVDFTGADIANQVTDDTIKTFTQEVRLVSDGSGPLNWLIGGFYSDEKIDTLRDIRFGQDARRFVNGLTNALSGAPLTATAPITVLEQLLSIPTPLNPTPTVRPGLFFSPGQGIYDAYEMKNRSFSIFGQIDYEIVDGLTLTAGGAYLNDRKAAVSNVILQDAFSSLNLNNLPALQAFPLALIVPGAPGQIPVNAFAGLNAAQFFYGDTANHGPVNFPNANESGVLKDDKFTYAGRIAYDLNNTLNVYASYSTGWKAGAYNLSSDSRPPNNGVGRTADPESVTVMEIGAKARFRGGYINVALFDQSIKGFQDNAFTGTGFALVNAGKQSVKGFEIDAAWRPFDALALNGAVTYLDPKFDSFTRATCPSFEPECQVPAGSPPGTRPPQFRDLSGQRPGGIPKWSGNVSAVYTQDLGGGYSAYLRGEYVFASDTWVTRTIPRNIGTFDMSTVNASLGFETPSQLVVQLWVRNLTKDEYLLSGFQTVVQNGSYSGYPNEPRTYGVTLRKSF